MFVVKYTVQWPYSSESPQEHTVLVEDAISQSDVFRPFGDFMSKNNADGKIVSIEECTDCPSDIEHIRIH
jgi:hypothetical protein